MSLPKSTTRRVALLSSSSLVAAGIAAAASLGLALTPGAALAQVCSETQAQVSDAAADTVTCPVGTYPTGIQYTAVGDLDLTVQLATTTPSSAVSNFGTGGVETSAGPTTADPDNLTVRLTGITASGLISYNAQPFDRLVDIQSQTGDILVDISAVRTNNRALTLQANNALTTHAIYAVSHGGGDVSITRTGAAPGLSIYATSAASVAAIEAQSIGGGDVTINAAAGAGRFFAEGGDHGILATTDGTGDILIDADGTGRLYGIRARATGTGAVTIDGRGVGDLANSFGIHATTGTGLLTINGRGEARIGGMAGVYIDAGGDVEFTGTGWGGAYGIYVSDVLAGTTTTLNLTIDQLGDTGVFAQGAGDLVINIVGDEITQLDFDVTGMDDEVAVRVVEDGLWRPDDGSIVPLNLGITIEEGGALAQLPTGSSAATAFETTVVTFLDPNSVLTNTGYVVVGPQSQSVSPDNSDTNRGAFEAELRLEGLGEFRHSGTILLGGTWLGVGSGSSLIAGVIGAKADGWYDDILSMPGVHWVGEGGVIRMDADISRSQTDCVRDPANGDLAAADCLRLVGGTTEGVTYLDIAEAFPGDRLRPTAEGIVLVEVTGGTSAQGHFAISPGMDGHSSVFGGSIDRGIYHYVLAYDESTQQHRLFGFTGSAAYQFAQYATAAHGLWRVATGTWLDRQADLRGGIGSGVGGGVWLRASGEKADRDSAVSTVRGGQTFTFDNTSQQTSYAVTGGVDLMSASTQDTAWVVGLMAGYNYADIEYDTWESTGQFDGFNIGGYASYLAGGLFVDAAVNANRLILKNDVPSLGIFPEGSILDTIVVSVGAQLEAGWRLQLTQAAFIEPLASLSYVRSKYDDVEVASADPSRPGINVLYDDPTSFRASIGGRAGIEQDFGFARAQFSVLGRLWNELAGENTIFLENEAFPDETNAAVVDDFAGQITELGIGASIAGEMVSGFVNIGGKFGDDYQAQTGTVGVRVTW